jgi:peptide/histidine transporter 3/4
MCCICVGRWFDKAAIVTNEDAKDSKSPNLWRIATVHRIEELKCIVRMLPIWSAGILLVTASSHLHSFVIQQARSMDRHLSHSFEIPPASLSIFSILTMLIGLVLYVLGNPAPPCADRGCTDSCSTEGKAH